MSNKTYIIFLTPSETNIYKPHVWVEGGEMKLFTATMLAKEIKKQKQIYNKRKNLYSKVEVLETTDEHRKEIAKYDDRMNKMFDKIEKLAS